MEILAIQMMIRSTGSTRANTYGELPSINVDTIVTKFFVAIAVAISLVLLTEFYSKSFKRLVKNETNYFKWLQKINCQIFCLI